MLLVHIGDGRLEMFATSHPLFRLPLCIMGMAAALLSLRGVEYPQDKSGTILQDLSPWNFPSANCIKSTTETNPKIWASKTDRSSFLLILVILYTAVNSTCDLKVGQLDIGKMLHPFFNSSPI